MTPERPAEPDSSASSGPLRAWLNDALGMAEKAHEEVRQQFGEAAGQELQDEIAFFRTSLAFLDGSGRPRDFHPLSPTLRAKVLSIVDDAIERAENGASRLATIGDQTRADELRDVADGYRAYRGFVLDD